MESQAVLDVGCGTGMLLRLAREAGHGGRLVGLDPADAMLDVARAARADIEWVHGDLASVGFGRAFDLVVMSGHAFQVFVTDDEVHATLAAVAAALNDDGRFAFESRNPAAREWEKWLPAHAAEIVTASGEKVRMEQRVEHFDGARLTFTLTFVGEGWTDVSRSTLRFLDAFELDRFLDDAGLVVEARYGDWDGRRVTAASPEIITVTRARGRSRAR
jgi:SAM-dependent methyltransferase